MTAPNGARLASRLTVVVLSMVIAGCSVPGGLVFTVDDRLTFTAPEDRADVQLPLTIAWEMEAPPEDGYHVVFVDRAPVRPGEDLDAVVGSDDVCRRKPDCPDRDYLVERGVFETTDTSIVLEELPRQSDEDPSALHDATVVLFGPDGRRMGEAAWLIQFRLREGDAP